MNEPRFTSPEVRPFRGLKGMTGDFGRLGILIQPFLTGFLEIGAQSPRVYLGVQDT